MATGYYEILGLETSADAAQIKAAYKRLAMLYHPDRNAGSKEAEDMFKRINDAYHVLSDPLKKIRYDNLINPQSAYTPPVEDDQHEINRKRYWKWQQAQQTTYKIDKNYFKIQALAFLVFIVISGFCFALVHTAYYFVEQRRLAKWQNNSKAIQDVKSLFSNGNIEKALQRVSSLTKQDPLEFRFPVVQDSLLDVLHEMAEQQFKEHHFAEAITLFKQLQPYTDPSQLDILQRIAQCQYYLGNYPEALQALKHLHHQDSGNLQLIYEISLINLDHLDNIDEAVHYLELGKKLFKKNLSEIYGEAFMLAVNPKDIPDVYYLLFETSARANLTLKRYNEVYADCNWGIYLRPNLLAPYQLRINAALAGGRQDSLCEDLQKCINLGDTGLRSLLKQKCR